MFILFGTRTATARLASLIMQCLRCHHAAGHHLMRRRTRFTLFFIPVFPISSKHFLLCTACGHMTEVATDRVESIESEADHQKVMAQQQYQPFDPSRQSPYPQNLSPN